VISCIEDIGNVLGLYTGILKEVDGRSGNWLWKECHEVSRGDVAMTKDRHMLEPSTRNHQGRRGRYSSVEQPNLK